MGVAGLEESDLAKMNKRKLMLSVRGKMLKEITYQLIELSW